MSKIKIGILGFSNVGAFFSNGLYQNAWSLAKMLKDSGEFSVTLFCQKISEPRKTIGIQTQPKSLEALKKQDIIISVVFSPSDSEGISLKKSGVKIINVKYGNNLCSDIETFVNKTLGLNSPHNRNEWFRSLYSFQPDLLLIAPQFEYQKQYMALTSGVSEDKVATAPYIWSSQYLSAYSNIYRKQIGEEYDLTYKVGDERNKRIVCVEPSISFIKSNMIPIIVANEVYKEDPSLISKGYAFNSGKLLEGASENQYLMNLLKLEIFRDKTFSIVKRSPMIDIMAKAGRVLLSHQILNSLNYTYFEFALNGYPFVHNSRILSHYGYYYEDNKVLDAKDKLKEAMAHDQLSEKERMIYKNSCQEMVWAYSPGNPKNILRYTELIKSVI